RFQGVNRSVPPDATLAPQEGLVSVIPISTGPHRAIIQREMEASCRHLGAVLFDENRSTGLRGGRGREVEVVNLGNEVVSRSDLRVSLRFYEGPESATTHFRKKSSETIRRIHEEGTSVVDLVPLKQKHMERWFSDLSSLPSVRKSAATVVCIDGVTHVPWEKHYSWQKDAINSAVSHGSRIEPSDHAVLTKLLEQTSANGRMLITHNLPSASHLEALFNEGIRTFIFKGMRTPKCAFEGFPENRPKHNFYMDQGLHLKLMELEHQGADFIWWPKSVDGMETPRQFYKNMFVSPDAKDHYDRFRNNGLGIAMFGASRVEACTYFQDTIHAFGQGLPAVLNDDTAIAIMDGNGPGIMEAARRMASQNNFLRISIGMDFEQVGEKPDFDSEALLFFVGDQIEYRQTFLEYLHSIPIVNVGGDGTDYERVLSKLKVSLANSLPLPMYWVDGRGLGGDHFYAGAYAQTQMMISDSSDELPSVARPWVRNFVHLAKDYDEVLDHMRQTLPCLERLWIDAGVPQKTIHTAYANHVKQCQKVDIKLPSFLSNAYTRYCNQIA
ncbi:MAG: hypothetical protein KC680_01920, partial [Candidatus Peregrinibacteria bacterium]|nr:hypothetical protein [Candidatus Peregrinibacteria bacterium]